MSARNDRSSVILFGRFFYIREVNFLGGEEIIEFYSWERQQLESMVKRSIDETKAQIKQFEAANQDDQLRTAKSRLRSYLELLEKVRAL